MELNAGASVEIRLRRRPGMDSDKCFALSSHRD